MSEPDQVSWLAAYKAFNAELARRQADAEHGFTSAERVRLLYRVRGLALQCKTREQILSVLDELVAAERAG